MVSRRKNTSHTHIQTTQLTQSVYETCKCKQLCIYILQIYIFDTYIGHMIIQYVCLGLLSLYVHVNTITWYKFKVTIEGMNVRREGGRNVRLNGYTYQKHATDVELFKQI